MLLPLRIHERKPVDSLSVVVSAATSAAVQSEGEEVQLTSTGGSEWSLALSTHRILKPTEYWVLHAFNEEQSHRRQQLFQ